MSNRVCVWLVFGHALCQCVFGVVGVPVYIDTHHVLHEVDERFLSVTIDSYLMQDDVRWDTFNFSSVRVRTLLEGLSPAIIRIGGTPADFTLFDKSLGRLNKTGMHPSSVVMTKADWDNLVKLSLLTDNRILFDLNLQLRFGDRWDPTNAMDLLDYSTANGYGSNIDFELGNEPGLFDIISSGEVRLSGTGIGQDLGILRKLLRTYPQFQNASLVGPDIMIGYLLLNDYLASAGDIIKACTIHHYYFAGPGATYKDYVNPVHFTHFPAFLDLARSIIQKSKYPDTPLWVGETSDASNFGTENVSDRFVSGFLWLEKLGMAALKGVKVVMRQDFYGHNYGLINWNLQPNPDYWLSWLYKRLVGRRVLEVKAASPVHLRVYAHCTHYGRSGFAPGSVVVFAINVQHNPVNVTFNNPLSVQSKHVYLLEPHGEEGLLSQNVMMNKTPLKLVDDRTFPTISPYVIGPGEYVEFPPLSFGFVVFPDAKAEACI